MTRISDLPRPLPVLPNAAEAGIKPRAVPAGADFQSQLKAQFNPVPLPAVSASARVLSDSSAEMALRPNVEVMLQLLAGRKMTPDAPSKTARASAQSINPSIADEHSPVVCPEPIQDPGVWCADASESDLLADAPFGSGLNAAAIAVALSGTTLIWVPSEIVRAPLQSPRGQNWRRRTPGSAEGHSSVQSGVDIDPIQQ